MLSFMKNCQSWEQLIISAVTSLLKKPKMLHLLCAFLFVCLQLLGLPFSDFQTPVSGGSPRGLFLAGFMGA